MEISAKFGIHFGIHSIQIVRKSAGNSKFNGIKNINLIKYFKIVTVKTINRTSYFDA